MLSQNSVPYLCMTLNGSIQMSGSRSMRLHIRHGVRKALSPVTHSLAQAMQAGALHLSLELQRVELQRVSGLVWVLFDCNL